MNDTTKNQMIRIRTGVKAGGFNSNHSETQRVRTGVRAGTIILED